MKFFETKWPAVLLLPFSLIYGIITGTRNWLYDTGILKQHRVNCKVISVGNITVGGTGKTPTVIFLAEWLVQQGLKVAVLSRGYGRHSKGTVVVSDGKRTLVNVNESGDEPQLISKRVSNVPVVVDEDRIRGANKAIELFAPDVLVLDDAFQHRRIFRDVNILLFKRVPVWGNSFLLPAGPLRESRRAIKRADILWSNFDNQKNFAKPFIQAQIKPSSIRLFNGKELNKKSSGDTFLAFSGIANPKQFHTTCEKLNLNIISLITFKDHHNYTAKDIDSINNKADELGATWIITTEKDLVKLVHFPQTNNNWAYLPIEIKPLNEQTLTHITQLLA
jgi:tetraacyldisaccharide 4'-kinase